MARSRPLPVILLVAWTLLTWTGRVPLLWGADGSTGSKVLQSISVLIFVALGVAGLVLLVQDRAGRPNPHPLVPALAVWSIGYWLVRLPLILGNDHPAAFKVVHSVLGLVAGGLGIAVLIAVGLGALRPGRAPAAPADPGTRRARA